MFVTSSVLEKKNCYLILSSSYNNPIFLLHFLSSHSSAPGFLSEVTTYFTSKLWLLITRCESQTHCRNYSWTYSWQEAVAQLSASSCPKIRAKTDYTLLVSCYAVSAICIHWPVPIASQRWLFTVGKNVHCQPLKWCAEMGHQYLLSQDKLS